MIVVILGSVLSAWWTAAWFYESELGRWSRRALDAEARLAAFTGAQKGDNLPLSADRTRKGA